MTEQLHGTVAVLELKPFVTHSFEDIVEEFDLAFRPPSLTRQSLTRDGDDVAIIERGQIRIVLGWLESPAHGRPHHLVIGIGTTSDHAGAVLDAESYRLIKAKLLMHAEEYLPISTVLHTEATRPVGADLVDTIADLLHYSAYRYEDHYADGADPARRTDGDTSFSWNEGNNTFKVDPTYTVHAKTEDILDAEFVSMETLEQTTLPRKLTVYTVGATMMMVSPPVGATFIIYASLRALTTPQDRLMLNESVPPLT
ncbi:MAG TPA: hypothetical protein VJ942_16570 [Roseovarius sp.]|nr:hypothetical protein [Roseovarius sp.]